MKTLLWGYPKGQVRTIDGSLWEGCVYVRLGGLSIPLTRWNATRGPRLARWSNVRYWKRMHELAIRRRRAAF